MIEKTNKKQLIIEKAAMLIHYYGYNNLGISKILSELGIPKGTFYHFFKSKEEMLLEVIRLHRKNTEAIFTASMTEVRSLKSLKVFFNHFFDRLKEINYTHGCPIGNLMTEISDLSEDARKELMLWSNYLEDEISTLLVEELNKEKDYADTLANFIVSSFEGAVMKSKVERSGKPLENFNEYIFNNLIYK